MAEKSNGKGNKRNRLARVFLEPGSFTAGPFAQLTILQFLIGVGVALVVTFLLMGYQFQRLPQFSIGDIADRTIEAPQDFHVEDQEATLAKKQEALKAVPAVFDVDLRINNRVEAEIRRTFAASRQLIAEVRKNEDIPASRHLPRQTRDEILAELRERYPDFNRGEVLEIGLTQSFAPTLENQLVRLLQESMKYPGVVFNRDALLRYRDRGFLLRNTITDRSEPFEDWMAIRDLARAREILRQSEYELTGLSGEARRQLVAFLEAYIQPNVSFNEMLTRMLEEEAIQEVDPVLIQIKKGRTIVRAGDEIRARDLMVLETLAKIKQPERLLGKFAGILVLVVFFLLALWQYLWLKQDRQIKPATQFLLVSLVLVFSLVVTKVFVGLADLLADNLMTESLQNPLHFYLVAPMALGAILMILLVGIHVAILYSLIFSVFAGLLAGHTFFAVYGLAGSLIAIHILDHYRERSAIIRAGLIIGGFNVVIALALQLYAFNTDFQWSVFAVRSLSAFLSGLFAAMLASVSLPVLESLFELTTDIRLLELSNLNKPILKRLALEAPGTYHHSIMVGTLGEAAAEAIGANPLLVRVGAYYHDIGKLRKPEYYVENQIYTGNKHETLSPNMSSLILASHVKDGLAMAEEIGLLSKVRGMIPQHHGTRLMTYFYQKAKDTVDDKHREVNEEDFRYPGPKPQTKEAAILMLADQVEAAARTLQDPTPGQIRSLIRRLIQSTIQDGQFDECDITLKELEIVAQTYERVITGMYHHRIEYPGFQFNKEIDEKRPEDQRIQ
jgi:cyclic-di-AMP phosphodiesterase PgpH